MSGKLSISGDDDGWQGFGKTPKGGQQRLFRSRAGWPPVRAYALENHMMRVRCLLRRDQVRGDGMQVEQKVGFLDALSLSQEQVQAAAAAGRVHGVSTLRSGGFLGKMFDR
jgi:hypothetical protein